MNRASCRWARSDSRTRSGRTSKAGWGTLGPPTSSRRSYRRATLQRDLSRTIISVAAIYRVCGTQQCEPIELLSEHSPENPRIARARMYTNAARTLENFHRLIDDIDGREETSFGKERDDSIAKNKTRAAKWATAVISYGAQDPPPPIPRSATAVPPGSKHGIAS